MTLEKTDLLLVSRNGNSFQMAEDDIKTNLADTDLLWVQRNGVDYSIQGVEIKNSGAGGDVEPDPATQVEVPGSLGGTGTESDPFIIPPANAFPYGGVAESSILIYFKGLEWQQVIEFEDENRGANGNERFVQPLGIVNQEGTYSTKLFYSDDPVSTENKSFTALLTVGDSVYFSWDVTQTDTIPPVINTVNLSESGSPTSSFTLAEIAVDVDYTEVGKPEAIEALQLTAETRAVGRASSSNVVSSTFTSVDEVEIKVINNNVSIAAKDINWDSSFSTTVTSNVVGSSDKFIDDTTSIFWMGFKSTNGERFCPQLLVQKSSVYDAWRYTYWFYSNTGLPNSWVYFGILQHKYSSTDELKPDRQKYNSPVGAAKYWICFNSTKNNIGNDGSDNREYIPYSTREDWPADYFGSQGYDWGLTAVELEDNKTLSQFVPGNYILHADTKYVDVAKTGGLLDYRWNAYYIPLQKSDTYPLFINEDMMLTDFQQLFGKEYDGTRVFGYGLGPTYACTFPGDLVNAYTVAPTGVYNNACIYDIGEVIVEGTVRLNSTTNLNYCFSQDGKGWSPVVLSDTLPTDTAGYREFTLPVGTRWIACITPPNENTQTVGVCSFDHVGAAEFKLRQRSPAGQLQYVDKAANTLYLNNVLGEFTSGKELFNCQVNTTEQILNTLNAQLDADGNVTNIVPFGVDPVVQNTKNQTIKFPSSFPSGVTPEEMIPYGSSVQATVTASNVAGSSQATSDPYTPPAAEFNFSFDLINYGSSPSRSFYSNPINMVPDDDDYLFFVWAGGASTSGKCVKVYWTDANWYNGIAGGKAEYGDDGDKNPGNNGRPPKCSLYLTKRRSVIIEVTEVDGDGGVVAYNVIQDGLGLNTQNIGQSKLFYGGTGNEVQLKVVRNADQTTGCEQVTTKGVGYTAGDVLTWQEGFGLGGLTQMDDVYDKLLYGVAGSGPIVGTAKGAQSTNGGEAPNLTTTTIYPSDGGSGVRYTCDYCNGGDGGSAGWGGAPNASGSGGHEGRHGNDAWQGWSGPNANYVSGVDDDTTGKQSLVLRFNGGVVVTVSTNQTVTAVKLKPSNGVTPVTVSDYSIKGGEND